MPAGERAPAAAAVGGAGSAVPPAWSAVPAARPAAWSAVPPAASAVGRAWSAVSATRSTPAVGRAWSAVPATRPAPPPPWTAGYPVVPQPNPYAYSPPSRYTYAPPSHRGRNVIIGSIVATLVIVVAVVAISASQSPKTQVSAGTSAAAAQAPTTPPASTSPDGITASSPLVLAKGKSVFSDDFTDPESGWDTGTDADSTYAYTPDGYSMSSHVPAHFLSYAPYDMPAQQVSLSVTAVEAPGAHPGAGFGVTCRRGPDSTSQLRYEFVVSNSGDWFVERNQGDPSIAAEPTILREGPTQLTPGASALTVSGVCATLADGTTTRLALFINGTKVVDMLNVATADGPGWLGGILTHEREQRSGDGDREPVQRLDPRGASDSRGEHLSTLPPARGLSTRSFGAV